MLSLQTARAEKWLDKPFRIHGAITTFRQVFALTPPTSKNSYQKTVPEKWRFGMYSEPTHQKTIYSFTLSDGSIYDVPKVIFDRFTF